MNIPAGNIVEGNISFEDSAPNEKVVQLLGQAFEGYVVATTEGAAGIEEALFLLKDSEIVGVVFESIKFGKVVYGISALKLSLNLLRAKKGVFDVVGLSKQQIDLAVAFNDKIELKKHLDAALFSNLLPSAYRIDVVLNQFGDETRQTTSKETVLKRFGLDSI